MNTCWRKYGILMMALIIWQLGMTQPDVDSLKVDLIYVEKPGQKSEVQKPVRKKSKDLFRNLSLVKIDLNDPSNTPLLNVNADQSGNSQDLMSHLLVGLQQRQVEARHPQNIHQPYDYLDLMFDLMKLEGVNFESLGEEVSKDDIGFQWVLSQFDLLVDKGFSMQNSRKFRRIRFLRVIWDNPATAKGAHLVALFPFESIAPFLNNLRCVSAPRSNQWVTVREFLDLQLYRGKTMSLEADYLLEVPLDRTERDQFKLQNDEIWEH